MEGIQSAAKEWHQEKLDLLAYINQLQDIILLMRDDRSQVLALS